MSKFAHKPHFIDFGNRPGVRTIKFVHSCQSITVSNLPNWVELYDMDYEQYTPGGAHAQGKIMIRPIIGMSQEKYSDVITLELDGEDYYIPVVYAYDPTSIPLRDVINNSIMMASDVSPISERDRSKAFLIAKRWIQDHNGVTGSNMRFAEVPVQNGIAPIPGDFVSPVAVHVVSDDGFLLPLYFNDYINISDGQLQDKDGLYITDNNGIVIGAYGITPRPNNERPYTYYGADLETAWSGFRNHLKVRAGQVSLNGMCRFDASANEFVIAGPNIEKVVVQYICDPILRNQLGIDHGDLKVHKNYQDAIEAYIYWKILSFNSRVPQNEKYRARQEYKLAMRRAESNQTNWNHVMQLLNGV